MENSAADLIERFAGALDLDDFDLAITMLDSVCVYATSAEIFTGPEAVIKSFRDASDWARQHLDAIVYIHSIEDCEECSGVIRFVDDVEHAGKQMRHTCLMHVTVSENGKIVKLRLEDLPGEKQKVAHFLQAVGVKR
jgi:hypothetical protein